MRQFGRTWPADPQHNAFRGTSPGQVNFINAAVNRKGLKAWQFSPGNGMAVDDICSAGAERFQGILEGVVRAYEAISSRMHGACGPEVLLVVVR